MSDAPRLLFHGDNQVHQLKELPPPPRWRAFNEESRKERGADFRVSDAARLAVNAALLLRRPLLVTGKPGTGKSSLAYAVAAELELGDVLVWPVTTRSTLQHGLYHYDAVARLQDASLPPDQSSGARRTPDIGRYIRLGPLGTALLRSDPPRPRVVLVDEIDKGDLDLPNDLLHVFEEGQFDIPELARLPEGNEFETVQVFCADKGQKAAVTRGRVQCNAFPFLILTSNGEREFPPAFLRRCLRLRMDEPDPDALADIVRKRVQFAAADEQKVKEMIAEFVARREGTKGGGKAELATDQLLNAIYLLLQREKTLTREQIEEILFKPLAGA